MFEKYGISQIYLGRMSAKSSSLQRIGYVTNLQNTFPFALLAIGLWMDHIYIDILTSVKLVQKKCISFKFH